MACVIRWSSGTDEHEDDRTDEPICTPFANARMMSEGALTTPQGNVIQTIYVDLVGQLPPEALSLAKASEPRFDLRTADSVLLGFWDQIQSEPEWPPAL